MRATDALSVRRAGRPRLSLARVDIALAGALAAGGLVVVILSLHQPVGGAVVGSIAVVVSAVSVAARRRWPLAAAFAAVVGLSVYEIATRDPNGAIPPIAVVLSCYTLGCTFRARGRPAANAAVIVAALVAFVVVSASVDKLSVGQALSAWISMVLAPTAVGMGVARRQELMMKLARTAAGLRDEQARNTEHAKAEERNRVARELHDVVAHGVSVMVVQAGAARMVAPDDPAAARAALAVVGACGREALADLRRIVGVLRRDVDPDFGSGAGLADVARLVERVRFADVPTELHVVAGSALPPSIDLVAYRIIQEALTNVVKHGGEGATAQVRVTVGEHELDLDITNTGGAAVGGTRPDSPGLGLVGMHERVRAYGGVLDVGPRLQGGFRVHAVLPRTDAAPTRQSYESPPAVRRGVGRWRPTSVLVEIVFVLGWLIAMEVEVATSAQRSGPWLLNAAAVVGMAVAAFWRRRAPLLVLAVVGGLAVLLSGGLTSINHSTITGLYCLAVPLFAVGAWEERRRATLGVLVWIAGVVLIAITRRAALGGMLGATLMGLVVWTAGRIRHGQWTLTTELSETMTRLAEEQQTGARIAVATERTRIARELHGVVARAVVAIVVQADSAQRRLALVPDDATDTMSAIEQAGRDALTQLRRILGVLRTTDDRRPGSLGANLDLPSPVPVMHADEADVELAEERA